uniref:pectinesterase n=1 Tax=Opuntia streptacantha TaxID=393608 RepID=A0A7C8Z2Q4_OPUST
MLLSRTLLPRDRAKLWHLGQLLIVVLSIIAGSLGGRCVVSGNGKASYAYLGRPWGPFGRVVFAFTYMDQCIRPEGWHNWGKAENERTACFYEYRCFGPGCCPAKRVGWARQLRDEEASQFLAHSFVDPDVQRPWLAPRLGVRIPYSA